MTDLLEWQRIRYGDGPAVRAAITYLRERNWDVDSPGDDKTDLIITGFLTGWSDQQKYAERLTKLNQAEPPKETEGEKQ